MHAGHVYLVEDDDSVRHSLQDLLGFAGFQVRAWPHAQGFLDDLPKAAPAVVVTDMRMPGMNGTELHEALIERGRNMPVVYISGESSLAQGIRAMKLGAQDFLVKPFTREAILKAVAAAIERDRIQMQRLIDQARFDEALTHLAPRERQVLELLIKGYRNQEIMNELQISLPTAKQYKSQLMRKLGARSLSEIVKLSAGLNTRHEPSSH
jgi:two-component system response regulator FixJ